MAPRSRGGRGPGFALAGFYRSQPAQVFIRLDHALEFPFNQAKAPFCIGRDLFAGFMRLINDAVLPSGFL